MSEKYFLEKCIAAVEDAKGSYAAMAHLNLDPPAGPMYQGLLQETGQQLSALNKRLQNLQQNQQG